MNKGLGLILLNISVALYLFATGILGLTGRKYFPDGEIRRAVEALLKKGSDFSEVLIVILGILAIAAGAIILLKFFRIEIPVIEALLIVMAIVWIVFIVMVDIITPLNSKRDVKFVDWARSFGTHLMALAGIILATSRFGG